MTRSKKYAKKKPTKTKRKPRSKASGRTHETKVSLGTQKTILKYRVFDQDGKPIYVTETYQKETKQNKLYNQEKESFERVRLQVIPTDVVQCNMKNNKNK